MTRHRLGVALLVPGRVADEVQGIRRACGDGALDRIVPHLTLVPPVNVRGADLGAALGRLRRAAAASAPLALDLGPARSFAPASPTLYLAVGGADGSLTDLMDLRDAVFQPPLARPVSHSFVPHVTILDDSTPTRLHAGEVALADYHQPVLFDLVTLLEEQRDETGARRWAPIADARLGPTAVVATGPLQVELWVSTRVDPLVGEQLGVDTAVPTAGRQVVVTARRGEEVLGVITGALGAHPTEGPQGQVTSWVVAPEHRGQGVGRHLRMALGHEFGESGAPGV